ncbi:MAG: carotenoid oxygenase family protein, partial [Acidobacteriota bacterium]
KGSWDFHGKLTSKTFTAHPKIDPNTGELVCFGYAAKGEATPDIAYYVVDKAGAIVHETWIQAPYSGMVHDFAVTKDYVVFPIVPITSDLERLKRGAPHFMWDSRKDVYLGVLPRRGTAKDLRWFRGACRYSTHLFNGFNDGAKIYIDTPVAKGNVFPFFPDITGAPFDLPKSAPHISRWAIDMNSGGESFEETTFDTNITEFPRIDDRYHTQPHRHGYVSLNDLQKPWTTTWGPPQPFMYFNTMAHFDFAEQKLAKWYIGQGSDLEEVQFIPRAQNAPEGDGWLIALVNRHYEVRTELVVLDATRVADGPVATVYLPFRLRSGLHGTWVPSWQLPVEPIHT